VIFALDNIYDQATNMIQTYYWLFLIQSWGCCDCDRMVVGFTTTYAISAYHHQSCNFKPRSWRGDLDTTLCDNVCQW